MANEHLERPPPSLPPNHKGIWVITQTVLGTVFALFLAGVGARVFMNAIALTSIQTLQKAEVRIGKEHRQWATERSLQWNDIRESDMIKMRGERDALDEDIDNLESRVQRLENIGPTQPYDINE